MPDAIDQFLGFKKEIVSDAVGLMLVILVAVGLRTRLCSVILIVWLGLALHYLRLLTSFILDGFNNSNYSYFDTAIFLSSKLKLDCGHFRAIFRDIEFYSK